MGKKTNNAIVKTLSNAEKDKREARKMLYVSIENHKKDIK